MYPMNPPRREGYEPGPDFNRAQTQIATPFQYFDVALDVAGSDVQFNVAGDFLYVDASSTGTVELEVNNEYFDASAPFQVQAGFGLACLFRRIKLSWSAQPGKRVRIMYSTGSRIVPTNIMQIALNSAPRSSFSNTAKTVTNASAQLVAANSARSYLLIQNKDSSGSIWVNFGSAAATSANGVLIEPGGVYELNSNVATDAIQAIGSIASNANIVVVEG